MAYSIEFSPNALEHLEPLRKFDQQRVVVEAIAQQLTHEPLSDSRNRKPMRSNLVATRELRVGPFRVYYDVDDEQRAVLIRAVGVKVRNRVFIAGEEADLT